MARIGIVGATGYVGQELIRLLLAHDGCEISRLVSHSEAGGDISALSPSLMPYSLPRLCALDIADLKSSCDIIFSALPHGAAAELVAAAYENGLRVIDCSADFRYADVSVYNSWYKRTHERPDLLSEAVYGLPEIYRERIRNAPIVGNPGCYTTCSILTIAPLLKAGLIDAGRVIIDSKSGVSGAGKSPAAPYHYAELYGNMKAYGVATHRHTSEIEQELSLAAGRDITVSFTPHLLPVSRGILSTAYLEPLKGVTAGDIAAAYSVYNDEPFVTVLPENQLPELNYVVGSNHFYTGFTLDSRANRLICVSALDNMIKGAAGQAIQNMNIMLGMDEETGLKFPAWHI